MGAVDCVQWSSDGQMIGIAWGSSVPVIDFKSGKIIYEGYGNHSNLFTCLKNLRRFKVSMLFGGIMMH